MTDYDKKVWWETQRKHVYAIDGVIIKKNSFNNLNFIDFSLYMVFMPV